MSAWMSREEALAALKVRPQTLYAYASRGLVARRPDPDDPRRSLYRGDDVVALARRGARDRRAAKVAESALAWGEPVIPTTISTIAHGELILRGQRAIDLADRMPLEGVAEILWEVPVAGPFPVVRAEGDPFAALAVLVHPSRPILGRPRKKLASEAGLCVAHIASAFGGGGGGLAHERFASAWGLDRSAAEAVRRALVLLADHELNPSTFAVRVAASTGASMPACLLAGLTTLSGPRHGGVGAALGTLVSESERGGAEAVVTRWLAAGHHVPGFGHPLYPYGDPRATALLEHVAVDPKLTELRRVVADTLDLEPNIDFALLALARSTGMPEQASLALFATARAVGWAAHAMEQAASESFIRPRARYEGPPADVTR